MTKQTISMRRSSKRQMACIVAALCCVILCMAALAGCESSTSGGGKSAASSSSTATTATSTTTTTSTSKSSIFELCASNGKIDKESEAVNYIHDSLMNAGKETPPKIECEGKDNGCYIVHGYEVVKDEGGMSHTATWCRYSVSPSGDIFDITLQKSVDPKTMK